MYQSGSRGTPPRSSMRVATVLLFVGTVALTWLLAAELFALAVVGRDVLLELGVGDHLATAFLEHPPTITTGWWLGWPEAISGGSWNGYSGSA